MKNLTILILAGGFGSRLGNLTKSTPKALIKVNGRSLIDYAVTWAHTFNPQKIIVIGGYKFDQLVQTVNKIDSSVVLIKNEIYSSLRMTGVMAGKDVVVGDLMIFDGDYIYTKTVSSIIARHNYTELTVHAANQKSDFTAQDVIVKLGEEGRLKDLFKTKDVKELKENEVYFNSLIYCPFTRLKIFFQIAEQEIKKAGEKGVHVEDAVMAYLKQGNPVEVFNTVEPLWMEVDNLEELKKAGDFVDKHKNDVA